MSEASLLCRMILGASWMIDTASAFMGTLEFGYLLQDLLPCSFFSSLENYAWD